MRRPKFLRLFTSVFTKLLLIIFIAGMGITLGLIIFLGGYRHHVAASIEPHLVRYVGYLVKEMGDPPDPQRASRIAAETDMVIAYDSPGSSWRTAEAPFHIPPDAVRWWHRSAGIQVGGHHGNFIVRVRHGAGRLTFYLARQEGAEKRLKILTAALFVWIALLMVAAFFAIRRVLKPLVRLKKGVLRVARGELDQRLPLKGADELRDLSAAFNTMTERLEMLVRSKEQLLLDVSHELRTPLTRLKVALALLPDDLDKSGIEEDLREMERKIAELLDTARALQIKASLHLAPERPERLMEEVAARLAAGRPVIEIEPSPPMPRVTIDGAQVRKALKNIVDNAQKYSADDGPPVKIDMDHRPPWWVITVKDRGMGIPTEDLDFIFEPFYRVDKSRTPQTGGYGLGLSLAKSIIEAHGGRIEVSSQEGRGTTVTVFLPVVPRDDADEKSAESQPS